MSRRIPIALFAVAASVLSFLVVLARVLAVVLPLGEFLLILVTSFGFFGMALAAVQLLSRWLHDVDIDRYILFSSGAIALAAMLAWAGLTAARAQEPFGATILALVWFLAAVIFSAGGFLYGCAFAFYPDRIRQWLMAGFGGAAAGTLLGVVGLQHLWGVGGLLFGPALALAGGLLAGWEERRKAPWIAACAAWILLVFFLVFFLAGRSMNLPWLPDSLFRAAGTLSGPEAWNGYSLATVRESDDGPAFAINGKRFPRFAPLKEGGQDRFVVLHGLAFPLLVQPDVLIFGPTTETALLTLGKQGATATWLDSHGLKNVCTAFPSMAHGCLPEGSDMRIVNPRQWIRRPGRKFDLIHFSIFHAPFHWQTGPFALFGDPMITLEAFSNLFDRLDEGGVLQLTTAISPEDRLVRLAVMALKTLKEKLAANPDTHLFIAKDDRAATILVKKEPFSIHEVTRLLDYSLEKNVTVLYSPFRENPACRIRDAAAAREIEAFYPPGELPVDDHPFFFSLSKADPKEAPTPETAMLQNIRSFQSRGGIICGIWLLCAGLAPLFAVRAHRMVLDEYLRRMTFFATAVVGMTLTASTVLYTFQLYMDLPRPLPVWGAGVLFFCFGLGAAAGSVLEENSSFSRAKSLLLASLCAGLAVDVIGPILFHETGGIAQVLFALLLVGILGLFAGAPMGCTWKRMNRPHRNVTAWMVGVAVTAFPLGLALSALLAGAVGYTGMIWIGLTLQFASMWLWSDL